MFWDRNSVENPLFTWVFPYQPDVFIWRSRRVFGFWPKDWIIKIRSFRFIPSRLIWGILFAYCSWFDRFLNFVQSVHSLYHHSSKSRPRLNQPFLIHNLEYLQNLKRFSDVIREVWATEMSLNTLQMFVIKDSLILTIKRQIFGYVGLVICSYSLVDRWF